MHDAHDSRDAKADFLRNAPVRLALLVEPDHLRSFSVGLWTFSLPSTKGLPPSFRGCETGSYPFPKKIPLEFGKRSHQRCDELSMGSAQVELQAGLRDQRDLPGLEILEGLHQVHGAPPPPGQFCDKDRVNAPVLGKVHDPFALGALVLGTGGNFLPYPGYLEACPLGKVDEIPFLAFAGLVHRGDPAVDGDFLYQLNSSDFGGRKRSAGVGGVLCHYACNSTNTEIIMKRNWTERELSDHWSLSSREWALLFSKHETTRLGFALLLKFLQVEGRFPNSSREIPKVVIPYMVNQVGGTPDDLNSYPCDFGRGRFRQGDPDGL